MEHALSIDPGFRATFSNIVFKKQYDFDESPGSLFAYARRWNDLYGGTPVSSQVPKTSTVPDRKLNIAYLTSHFARHPVGYFVEPVIASHDPSQVNITCYMDSPVTDEVGERIKSGAQKWISVNRDTHEALVERIQTDFIDILVDLDGHSGPNRLPMFTSRAAPLQVTWAGYVGTTGLDAMDYLITDQRQTLNEDMPYLSECPVFMPDGYVCIRPLEDAPDIEPIPTATNRFVTFGSFNTLDKLNGAVIDLWVRCLSAVPDSRLKLIAFDLGDPVVRTRIESQFSDRGISAERLDLSGKLSHQDLLAAYNTIDIALDPFPYSGGLTTLEALWMGVPVVTKNDRDRFASRHSVTHLTTVGLTETIASDSDGYIDCAMTLAKDEQRRSDLKETLREQMRQSHVCDTTVFTRNLEKAYRAMWRRHCAGEPPSAITVSDLH